MTATVQTTTPPATPSALPPRPRLVLRAGFAGRKELSPDERSRLAAAARIQCQPMASHRSILQDPTKTFTNHLYK
jgi:hypothetical protein